MPAGAFDGNEAGVVLAEALQAASAGGGDVCPPLGAAHGAVRVGVDEDAAVDDGDEVGIRDKVEYCAGPGPVDAAEDHVAVEGAGQAVGFDDRQVVTVDDRPMSGGGSPQRAAEYIDLTAATASVAASGVQEPVEVDQLDDVEVHQREPGDAGPGDVPRRPDSRRCRCR